MGWPEIGVIVVVGLMVFGPDRLPDMARQAGKFIRTVRQMADNAKNDLGREIGHDLSGMELRDLDPREVVRRSFLDEADTAPAPTTDRSLRVGEVPPYDPEST
ncbi:sec-independent translocase [Aeromicrobium sp. Root495]|uniref:sec-independent translocase n=1 Tax=Aeromicrobium sp. Root495 TaxID=1736550 RepID=UPI000AF84229|nr:sec-independent translocase [Aeromicrobium sp. Root495]